MKTSYSLLFVLLFFCPSLGQAQFSIEDHLGREKLNSISVFGNSLIYCKVKKESWNSGSTSSIILSDLEGKKKVELTENEYDYAPKWSPDGQHISFISYRNNLQQIYILDKNGGAPKMASDAQAYISNYQWLDQETIAYVDDEPRDSLLVAKEKENGGGYIVGTEFYTNALWLYNINTGTKKKMTSGQFRILEFDISSDGKYLAMIKAKNYDTYEAITNSSVEVIEIKTGKAIYNFAEANAFGVPSFSPDGMKLSFVGSTVGYAANDGLFVADLETGQTQNLTYEFDPTIQKLQWIDNQNISFSMPRNGYTGIYSVNLAGEINTMLKPIWVIYDFQVKDQQLFFIGSRSSKTKQLYKLVDNGVPVLAKELTALNAELNKKNRSSSKLLAYQSKDGTDVQAVVNYPPDYDQAIKYPLMVIPHGGPDAVVMDDYDIIGQFFANNGYVVLQPNFRGSIGYGRDFYAGNRNSFGYNDLEDILAGVNKLIELDIVDPEKLVLGGWSYGGYMANWAITQTDIFKASISVAGMSNLVSLYGQHEFSNRKIGLWEYKALLNDNIENYRKASPIFFVKKINTPLLILHGANDARSPTLQAWEMYRAMQDANKEVEMIIYPRAGHSISNPIQFKSVLNNWLDWADKHIGKK